ncbi:conserved hypothetical protein [Magpiepox virus]|nr:conserved hypothetical protein [Magpiepox virus]
MLQSNFLGDLSIIISGNSFYIKIIDYFYFCFPKQKSKKCNNYYIYMMYFYANYLTRRRDQWDHHPERVKLV